VIPGLSPYEETLAAMEAHAAALLAGTAGEAVWLVEHPRVYTGGTSARDSELVGRDGVAVVRTGRGGRFTYHGPGQRVVYPILDLGARGRDVRAYVHALEQWVIDALAILGVPAFRTADTGVWTDVAGAPAKIAAIGVRVRRWISFHGFSVNVSPELADYAGIVPCGIADRGVTSLQDLGSAATMTDLDRALFGTRAVLPARLNQVA
jgi:lipoyl(octanoyl) transferase